MTAQVYATTGPFKYQAWCDECKDGVNGNRTFCENWEYVHNTNHHAPDNGAFHFKEQG